MTCRSRLGRPGWLSSIGVRWRCRPPDPDPWVWRFSRLDLGEIDPPDPDPDPDPGRFLRFSRPPDPDPCRPRPFPSPPDPRRCRPPDPDPSRPDPDRVGVDPDRVLTDPDLVGRVPPPPRLPADPDPLLRRPEPPDPEPEGDQRPDRSDVGEVARPRWRACSRSCRARLLRLTLRRWLSPRAARPTTSATATAMPSAGVPAEAAAALVTATVFAVATAVGAAGRPFVRPREGLGAVAGASGPATACEGSGDTVPGSGAADVSTFSASVALASAIFCHLLLLSSVIVTVIVTVTGPLDTPSHRPRKPREGGVTAVTVACNTHEP